MADKLALQARRRARLRYQLKLKAGGRPRLSVFRSGRHIYAQVIDDGQGRTLAAASTVSKDFKAAPVEGDKKAEAKKIGQLIADKCKAANINSVVFDRNGFPYQGRVAAVADGARESGLKF